MLSLRTSPQAGVAIRIPCIRRMLSLLRSDNQLSNNKKAAWISMPLSLYVRYRLMSKFMFMIALMASALSVMLASPWMVCLMTELATAKLIMSMGL